MKETAVFGTFTVRGSRGIYSAQIDDAGNFSVPGLSVSPSAGYLVRSKDGNNIYAVNESMIFSGEAASGLTSYRIGRDGSLSRISRVKTEGQLSCHLCLNPDETKLFTANYLRGFIAVHPVTKAGEIGEGEHVIRLKETDGVQPSLHCVLMTPDGKLCAVDSVSQSVCLFELQSGKYETAGVWRAEKPYNTLRPRQIVFLKDRAYLLFEKSCEIRVLAYHPDENSVFSEAGRIHLVPAAFKQEHPELDVASAAIRVSPDEKYILCSTRGYNTLSVFRVKADGMLQETQTLKLRHDCPRDFDLTKNGRFVVVASQTDDTIEVYRFHDDGTLSFVNDSLRIPCCVCVNLR